jgi:hypothetical protein
MNRPTMFVLTTMLVSGLAVVTLPEKALSQQKTLKEQIQGPWQLASCNSTDAKGEKTSYCANNPKGILILAGNGHYSATITAGGRKDIQSPGVAANFGTWSVDEASKTLTFHRDGALNPANEGRDNKANISLNGEELHGTADGPDGHLT